MLLALGGQVAGTAVAAGAWDPVRDAELVSTAERIDAGSGSLAVYTDVLQPDRDVTCSATPPGDDAEPVAVPAAPLDLSTARDGTTWYLIGFLLDGEDGLDVSCRPGDEAGDSATYLAAVADGYEQRADLGNGIGWIATLAGVALAVLVFVSRRRARQEGTA